jgi:hypothetical protein
MVPGANDTTWHLFLREATPAEGSLQGQSEEEYVEPWPAGGDPDVTSPLPMQLTVARDITAAYHIAIAVEQLENDRQTFMR